MADPNIGRFGINKLTFKLTFKNYPRLGIMFFWNWSMAVSLVQITLGGFSIEIITEIRYLMIGGYNFIR